eukprot:UN05508
MVSSRYNSEKQKAHLESKTNMQKNFLCYVFNIYSYLLCGSRIL